MPIVTPAIADSAAVLRCQLPPLLRLAHGDREKGETTDNAITTSSTPVRIRASIRCVRAQQIEDQRISSGQCSRKPAAMADFLANHPQLARPRFSDNHVEPNEDLAIFVKAKWWRSRRETHRNHACAGRFADFSASMA